MLAFAQGLAWWHWLIVAALLAGLETFLTGAIAIWFAVAAAVIAVLLLFVPVPWQLQLVLFGALGAGALLLWRRLRHPEQGVSDQPSLNQRGVQYIGQVFTLIEPIQDGVGRVRVGDTVWRVLGPPAPAGAQVRVVGVEGSTLRVETA